VTPVILVLRGPRVLPVQPERSVPPVFKAQLVMLDLRVRRASPALKGRSAFRELKGLKVLKEARVIRAFRASQEMQVHRVPMELKVQRVTRAYPE